MSRFHRLCRALPVLALLSAFLFTSLPAQAQILPRPFSKVAAPGERAWVWLRNLLTDLELPGMRKEGVMIDPNGGSSGQGAAADPDDDESTSIDPNGRT